MTRWYRNPVVWSTYFAHAVALFFAISPLVVDYGAAPKWLVTGIGVATLVLNNLGYQKHSADVRTAELFNASLPVIPPAPVTPLVPPRPSPLVPPGM